jgi:hypothetical protein
MSNAALPPLPRRGKQGPQVCEVARLYLAVIDDLSPAEVEILAEHLAFCDACDREFQKLSQVTNLVASLAESSPSPRVDRVIMELIATGQNGTRKASRPLARPGRRRPERQRRIVTIVGQLVAAAMIILALIGVTHVFAPQQAFALPANLSWSQYVLYHSETLTDASGERYRVESYHDLGKGYMHVETVMDGQMDVVVVGTHQQMLGMDMIHHVAQWGADEWAVDDSIFDLNTLRHDLQTNEAVYLGTDTYQGQQVYLIRCPGNLGLLLDMQYHPVNVLKMTNDSNMGPPMYDSFKLMPSSEVPASMWDMSIPPDFHMGTLPHKP